MKKEKIEWSLVTSVGLGKDYSIEGTELDRELVEAFFDMDKIKCLEILQKGAAINVSVTIKQNGEVVAWGPLFQHLIGEKPTKAQTAQLSKQIEDLKTSSRQQNYPTYIEKEIKQLQETKNQRIAQAKSHNEKREKEIIDFAEFWLDIGGGRPLIDGVNHANTLDLDKIEYPKVRDYIERATEIDRAVSKKIDSERMWSEKGIEEKFYMETTVYRTSDYTINEIKEKVQTDPNLNRNTEITM